MLGSGAGDHRTITARPRRACRCWFDRGTRACARCGSCAANHIVIADFIEISKFFFVSWGFSGGCCLTPSVWSVVWSLRFRPARSARSRMMCVRSTSSSAVLVARIDPDAVPLCEVTDLWAALDAVERRAAATKLLLARRVEEAGRWKRDGHSSAAEQLAGISGSSVTAAKGELETSKKVAQAAGDRAGVTGGGVVGGEGRSDRGGG